jgi:hypothetical protein
MKQAQHWEANLLHLVQSNIKISIQFNTVTPIRQASDQYNGLNAQSCI